MQRPCFKRWLLVTGIIPLISIVLSGIAAQPMARTLVGKAPNLVVLVHGCCTDKNGVKEWENIASEIMKGKTPDKWEIVVWDWSADTTPTTNNYALCPSCFFDDAFIAYDRAKRQGRDLATAILDVKNHYKYVHLIGHSAGANLIDVAAKDIAPTYIHYEDAFIYLTFLDAFTLSDFDMASYGFLPHYPDSKHYAEHYVDRSLASVAASTDACLSSAFNFNISNWQHSPEEGGFGGHQWPRHWYEKSVTSTSPKFKYGFPLSLEGGNNLINSLATRLAPGKQCSLSTLFDQNPDCHPADCWK